MTQGLKEFRDLLNSKNRLSDNLDVVLEHGDLYINAQQLLDLLDSLIDYETAVQ